MIDYTLGHRKMLMELCIIIDHLEQHGMHGDAAEFIKQRDAILAPTVVLPPKPAQQAQAKKR